MPGDEPSQGASMRMQLKRFFLHLPHSLDHPISKIYQLSEGSDTAKSMGTCLILPFIEDGSIRIDGGSQSAKNRGKQLLLY
jgi:hypothetical protein